MLEGDKWSGSQCTHSSQFTTEPPILMGGMRTGAAAGKTSPALITAVMCWQGEGRHKATAQLTY